MIWMMVLVVALLAGTWALRTAWRSFVLEMEGYEHGDDAGYVRQQRRRSRERRQAALQQAKGLFRGVGQLARKARAAVGSVLA